MPVENVEYVLSLKDLFSKGIDGAKNSVNKLEESLSSVKGLIGAVGIGFAAFEAADFLKESGEAWEKMEFSMSQVEAALKSTGEAAGLSFDELKKGAEDTAHNFKFAQSEILGMQSVLLTFPSVTKETFGDATNIILDMSTRLGQDLKSTAIQVGKALQDPEHGITALRRVGVNFNDEQTKLIKNLVNTGHAAEAQASILKELSVEFGGSAAAAADADKSFRFEKTMEENKVALGELIDKLKEEFMPVLISVAKGLKNVIEWIKENASWLKVLTVALGTAWIAFKTIEGAQAIMTIVTTATQAWAASTVEATAATEGMAVASTFALGPLGLLAAALGVVAGLYYEIADGERQVEEAKQKNLADVAKNERTLIEDTAAAYEKQGMRKEAAAKHAIEYEQNMLQGLIDENTKAIASADVMDEDKMNNLYTIQDNLLKKKQVADNLSKTGLVPSGAAKAVGKTDAGTPAKTQSVATGSKAVTINISIGKLIEQFKINTTNMQEGATKVKELVAQTLLSAVNDSQIVAGI